MVKDYVVKRNTLDEHRTVQHAFSISLMHTEKKTQEKHLVPNCVCGLNNSLKCLVENAVDIFSYLKS